MKKQKIRNQTPTHRPSLYGYHAVQTAWLNPDRRIRSLYVTSEGAKRFETVLAGTPSSLNRPSPTEVQKKDLDKLLPGGAVHQGIAIVCDDLPEVDLHDLIIAAQVKNGSVIVMLDQVTDPHNVGAIFRSACAFGASGIIMQKRHAPDLSGVLAKTACGAIEHIPGVFETNLSRAVEKLQENGFTVYGLAEEGTQDISNLSPEAHEKIVLVLGTEGSGLRRLIREKCDWLVRLPTTGPIGSLNVSNAAAVALYAVSAPKMR